MSNTDIVEFITGNSWFFYNGDMDELELESEDDLLFQTREYGCVGDEEPGEEDVLEAHRLVMLVTEKFNVRAEWDTTDEWTNLTVYPLVPFKNGN